MCGRFQLAVELDKILERYGILETSIGFSPQNEVFPSNMSLAVINEEGEKKLKMLKWGFSVSFAKKLLINARSETVTSKPTFRESFIYRRCLIPASGYYEWKKDNKKSTKYRIYSKENIFSLAGIYKAFKDNEGKKYEAYTILTRDADKDIIDIHKRMPVIINKYHENIWLDRNNNVSILKDILKDSDLKLLKECI